MNIEKELLKAVNSNDRLKQEEIFEVIYNNYYNLVKFCVRKYITNPSDVDELVNDVFINFFNNISKSIIQNIKYYLTISAKNLSLNFIRNNKKNNYTLDDEIVFSEIEDNKIIKADFFSLISKILNEKEINILYEHGIYNKTYKDIAAELNTTPTNVRVTYHRILNKIRKEINNEKK